MSDVDDVLQRTLNRAAEAAPPPPADLYRTVTRRYARRRSGAMVAAVAVFALLVGIVGVLKVTREDTLPVATPNTVEALWPDALSLLPRTIEGRDYLVDAVLANGRILVHTVQADDEVAIGLLDSDGGNWTVLTRWETRKDSLQISDVVTNATWAAWRIQQPGKLDEIFTLRWDEQIPRKVAETGSLGTFSIALDGDTVIYGPSNSGVRTVPATGGTPTLLPGTGGRYYRLYWPWLLLSDVTHQPKDAAPEIWNLRTDERRTAFAALASWRDACSPVWCVAVGDDDYPVRVMRFDGTDGQVWQGHWTNYAGLTPLLDRYLPLYRQAQQPDGSRILDLVDVESHRAVEFGRTKGEFIGIGAATVDWVGADGKRHLLDLRRIG
ncbi:hypothetical protein [Cryptosporangium sp. NPDC048952]|uniref:hypothetical protein n=1 Tax=Cryptosporangium sp. NPDC048952 TaxID=3363961 RepID=UPI0037217C8A